MPQTLFEQISVYEALEKILTHHKPNQVLIVGSKRAIKSIALEEYLDTKNINYKVFSEFKSNPEINDIEKARRLIQESKPQLVIAIGGGSAIDVSKAANFLAVQGQEAKQIVLKTTDVVDSQIPLVAIPTTAGSGAEATHFAVVYIDGKKHSLAHESLLPTCVILDATLTNSLTPYQTAVSGLDALCQAIESMWSINSTEESMEYARESLKLSIAYLKAAVLNPNTENRVAMQKAAYLAGKAINISKTTAPHAMSYALTTEFDIPHGHAVALTLPSLLKFNGEVSEKTCADSRGFSHVESIIASICKTSGTNNATEAAVFIENLIKDLGLKTRLREFGVREDDVSRLVGLMSLERAQNNPRIISNKEAVKLLMSAL